MSHGSAPVKARTCKELYLQELYLQELYLQELMERVSAGEVLEAKSNLSICVDFTVFSFVMAYNIKNVGGLF